jgi:hypothetical protein
MISSSRSQLAPNKGRAVEILVDAPPAVFILVKRPASKYAIERPSGEKTGFAPKGSVPRIRRLSRESSDRNISPTFVL